MATRCLFLLLWDSSSFVGFCGILEYRLLVFILFFCRLIQEFWLSAIENMVYILFKVLIWNSMSLLTTSETRKFQSLFCSFWKEKIKKKGGTLRHNIYASELHHLLQNLAFLINLSFLVPWYIYSFWELPINIIKMVRFNFSWDSQAWDGRSWFSKTSCFYPSFFLPMILVAKEILFFPITYVETMACKQLRPTKVKVFLLLSTFFSSTLLFGGEAVSIHSVIKFSKFLAVMMGKHWDTLSTRFIYFII